MSRPNATVQVHIGVENLGPRAADRLREGEWVILGRRVAVLLHATFCSTPCEGMISLLFEYPGVHYDDSDDDGWLQETRVVPRGTLFPVIIPTTVGAR